MIDGDYLRVAIPSDEQPCEVETMNDHAIDDGVALLQHDIEFVSKMYDLPLFSSLWAPPTCGIDLPGSGPENRPFLFNLQAPVYVPGRPTSGMMPDFVQELHVAWDEAATAWEGEDRSMRIIAHFVDHRDVLPHCTQGRVVHLFEDFTMWQEHIRFVWRDRIDPAAQLEFHHVVPTPPLIEPGIAAHLILVQAPQADLVTILASVFEGQHSLNLQFRIALTFFEFIHLENLIYGVGFAQQCFGPAPTHMCRAHFHHQWILQGQPLRSRSGYGITLQFVRRVLPAVPQEAHNGLQLLQTRANLISPTESERLTDSLVAHDCRPLSGRNRVSISLEETIPGASSMSTEAFPVKLQPGHDMQALPSYIELPGEITITNIQAELRHWGHEVDVFLFGDHPQAVCFSHDWNEPGAVHHYMFCNMDTTDQQGAFMHTAQYEMTEIDLMTLLVYGMEYHRL